MIVFLKGVCSDPGVNGCLTNPSFLLCIKDGLGQAGMTIKVKGLLTYDTGKN
jgi:hypothetical protein